MRLTISQIAQLAYARGFKRHLDFGIALPLQEAVDESIREAVIVAECNNRDYWKVGIRVLVLWVIIDRVKGCECKLCR